MSLTLCQYKNFVQCVIINILKDEAVEQRWVCLRLFSEFVTQMKFEQGVSLVT